MSFSGEVSKKSHEGGILASFEGKPPSLGTNIRITGGKTLGRVQSVIGNIENPLIHIFPLSRGIDSLSAIGANIEIAPRDRTPKPKNNRGRGSDRNRFQKNNDNMKSGDWICPKCKNHNFASKSICNRKNCNTKKPKISNQKNKTTLDSNIRPGDWICPKCKNHNYASKDICNRSSCDTRKPREGVGPKTTKKRYRSSNPRSTWSPKKTKKSNNRRR